MATDISFDSLRTQLIKALNAIAPMTDEEMEYLRMMNVWTSEYNALLRRLRNKATVTVVSDIRAALRDHESKRPRRRIGRPSYVVTPVQLDEYLTSYLLAVGMRAMPQNTEPEIKSLAAHILQQQQQQQEISNVSVAATSSSLAD